MTGLVKSEQNQQIDDNQRDGQVDENRRSTILQLPTERKEQNGENEADNRCGRADDRENVLHVRGLLSPADIHQDGKTGQVVAHTNRFLR